MAGRRSKTGRHKDLPTSDTTLQGWAQDTGMSEQTEDIQDQYQEEGQFRRSESVYSDDYESSESVEHHHTSHHSSYASSVHTDSIPISEAPLCMERVRTTRYPTYFFFREPAENLDYRNCQLARV